MASQIHWTWVWVNSGSWWWTRRLGVLQFTGSQRVGHDWATELNWCRCKFPSCVPFLPSEELPVTFVVVLVCLQWNLLASVCLKNSISMFKWYLYWVFSLIELFLHHLLKIKSEIILFPPVLFFPDSF